MLISSTFAACLLIGLFACGCAYKIAVFTPELAQSQILFSARVAAELDSAGHEVTLIRVQLMKNVVANVKIKDTIKQWKIGDPEMDFVEAHRMQSETVFRDFSFFEGKVFQRMSRMMGSWADTCETIIKNSEFMDRLKSAKFDIAFAYMYEMCPIGLIHAAKIPTWIWMNSGLLVSHVANYIGVPSPPSYVPPLMSEYTDRMTFFQRVKSLIGSQLLGPIMERAMVNRQTEAFRKYWDPSFPSLTDLGRKCPLVMVNSNELYNLARPTLHKVVYIGGIGMSFGSAKPLKGEFERIASNAKQLVVMTFGSHANSSAMPEEWKNAFLAAFSNFPDVDFIVRYSAHDLDSRLPKNVHFSNWIPQGDLLQHPKTKALITHGGYNSLQEAIYSAIPMVTISLFGDQHGNAELAAQHGFSYNVLKKDVSEQSITRALRSVLENPSYKEKIRRMYEMVKKKPETPERLLVRWTEFAAEFKNLDNLTPYSTQLNFIQYFCIDVILFLFFVVTVLLILLFYIFSLIIRFARRKLCPSKVSIKRKTQ